MSVERPAEISLNADVAQAEVERLVGDADYREENQSTRSGLASRAFATPLRCQD